MKIILIMLTILLITNHRQPCLNTRSLNMFHLFIYRSGTYFSYRHRHFTGHDIHHHHIQQSKPARGSILSKCHLRPVWCPWHGSGEECRLGGYAGASAQTPTWTQEDQGREQHRPPAGSALPHSGIGPWSVSHHCQRGENLQVWMLLGWLVSLCFGSICYQRTLCTNV